MRRKFYLGFAVVLIALGLLLAIWHSLSVFVLILIVLAAVWAYDVTQKKHAILSNFPILGHIRFVLEFFRPEIQQYFVA